MCFKMTKTVLLVGTGITTAVTGVCLSKRLEMILTVWDKARGIGGRMSTSRSISDDNCTVDLGAQYITCSDEMIKEHYDIYEPLLKEKILMPMNCKIVGMEPRKHNVKNYIAPMGSGSIVKRLIELSNINQISFQHQVNSITRQGNKWHVTTVSGAEDVFDVVILTMPVPQILQLRGSIVDGLLAQPCVLNKLNSVAYSSRYALGLFYSDGVKLNTDWDVKYFSDDPVLRYVAIDNKKRLAEYKPYSVVIHSTTEYGEKHKENNISEIEPEFLSHVKQHFPDWPEPKAVKCHKWRYSQVTAVYPGAPGYVTISKNPILIAAGDGFVGSTFDNCVRSAKNVAKEIETLLSFKVD